MRILVCGSRKWDDWRRLWLHLDKINQARYIGNGWIECVVSRVIHGDADGADRIAGRWAEARGIKPEPYPANWRPNGKFDRAAGIKRNARMLAEGKPDLVVAFRCAGVSKGTDDMIARAERAGVKVEVVRE